MPKRSLTVQVREAGTLLMLNMAGLQHDGHPHSCTVARDHLFRQNDDSEMAISFFSTKKRLT